MRPARTRCTHDSAADPIRLLLVGVTWSADAQPGLDYRRNRRVLPKGAPESAPNSVPAPIFEFVRGT